MAFIRSETDLWILLYYMALLFCVIIILCQIVGLSYNTSRIRASDHKSWVTTQGGTRNILISLFTTYSCSTLGIAVVISRIGNHLYDPILCEYTYMISFMLFATAKLCNYYFFLQRAKLAQGLRKIMPQQAFERIFPIIFISLYALYIVLIILLPIEGERVISPNTGRVLCLWTPPDIEHEIIYFITTIFEVFMTMFLLYLYGKPLLEIMKHTNDRTKSSQPNDQENKLRRCVMVNFICTAVASIHTAIVALSWYSISFMAWWSIMDYAVNCLCLFAMFASNRRLLLHCCCCCRNGHDRHLAASSPENSTHGSPRQAPLHEKNTTETLDTQQYKSHALKVQMQLNRPSRSDAPSLQTVSDFPQPQGALESVRSCKVYQDAAEQNNFVLKDDNDEVIVSYLEYLDDDCWYYKSKLFWTWFLYCFCFCGNGTVYKCYCCVWNGALCHKRMKGKRHVMEYMFGAAKKIQYMRYYGIGIDRQQSQSSRMSESQSTSPRQMKIRPKPSAGGLRSLSGINEAPNDYDTVESPKSKDMLQVAERCDSNSELQ
eukprot:527169_1